MANETYRAVFLRVHPTGKMVLSLTTEADGHEGDYARQVAGELGIPPLDVKVVPADLDRFGEGHGFNTTPSEQTSAAVTSATEKILAKARLLAGMALDAPPDALGWADGAFTAGDGAERSRTIADIAMYAHGTGALPPGIEGGLDAQTVYRD
ncbi:MAG: molybdopterin cofactor-binding domain-containing protein [Solirubrobacteraceae bacterium]|jgi:aerobic carbon-monoxide dehydrogenase large subunit